MLLTDSVLKQQNDWLYRWHKWAKHDEQAIGYSCTAPGFDQYRSAYHWRDNGDAEISVDNAEIESFDSIMQQIKQPHATALMILARNLYTGKNVWSSPRLPKDRHELDSLITCARIELLYLMDKRGLLLLTSNNICVDYGTGLAQACPKNI